jgi:hypothetical protein
MRYNRALFWHEHIGSGQYRLRIRNTNPGDNKQWFVFDWRTRSIRPRANRNLVMSVQMNGKNWFYYAYAAVVRPYRRESLQKMRWFNGSRRNIRDLGVRCLDVHGNSNTHHRHVHWYKCHNGLNQAWYIDRRGIRYPKQPLASGVKFQIRSRMTWHRALYWAQHWFRGQHYLRIQDTNPDDKRQWFTFDSRTQTIRAFYRRRYAIAQRYGYGSRFVNGQYAVIKTYTGHNTEKIQWHSGSRRNIRNNGRFCLNAQSNYHGRYVTYYRCTNGLNQAWFIDQRWYSYARQPYKNSRKFQIRSKMSGGRALGWWNHFGSHQYYVKLQDHSPFKTNQWWFIDHRTKSIRAFSKRNYALSNQMNYKHRQSFYVNIRPWRNEPYQKILFRGQRIVNHANLCLMPRGGRNTNKNYITFWMCKNSNNQYWFTDTRGVYFPRYPLRDGVRFQIKSQMKGNRAVFYSEHIGAHNYRLRIRNNYPEDIKQWWVFDWRTRSIRAQGNRGMAISIQWNHNNWYRNGYAAVVARYTGKYIQRIRWFNGSNRNIRDVGVRCLNVVGRSNTHNRHLSWYRCQNGGWQAWKIDTKGISYPRYPIRNGVKFQIRTRMASKRPIRAYLNSYVRLVDNNPYDRYQWFVFDWRTKTIRTIVNRAYVIQAYNSFNQGTYAQIRYFRKQPTQFMQWHEGSRRNIRHNRGLCMDVRGNRDKHLEYIWWYRCHNGLNQGWFLDQSGAVYRNQPFNNGVRFMIRSRMASNRALYHHYTHIGSH